MTADPNNPRYWASQWYSTKFAEEPWPGGWYWYDNDYNWNGPFDSEHDADAALQEYRSNESEISEQRRRARSQFALHYHPLSPHSQKVLVAIFEKNIRFEPHIVDLRDAGAREEYQKLYPMGQVPLIVLNHGPVIPESSIIVEYMDELGGPRMISEYPDVARKIRFKDRFMDLYLIDSVATLLIERNKPQKDRDSAAIETAEYRAGAVYEFLDHEVRRQTWANGEEFSLSDCTAAAALGYAAEVVPYRKHPNVVAYAKRLADRPSVQRMHAQASAYMEKSGGKD